MAKYARHKDEDENMKKTMKEYLQGPVGKPPKIQGKAANKQRFDNNDDDDGDIPHVIPWFDKPDEAEDVFW